MKNTVVRLVGILILVGLCSALHQKTKSGSNVSPIENEADQSLPAEAKLVAVTATPAVANKAPAEVSGDARISQPMTEAELKTLAQEVQSALPTLSDLKNLSDEEVHQIAKPILKGSLELKRYADQLEISMKQVQEGTPEFQKLASEGARFYEGCASGDQTPEALRAVCYLGFLKLTQQSGHAEDAARLHVPPEVVHIALAVAK